MQAFNRARASSWRTVSSAGVSWGFPGRPMGGSSQRCLRRRTHRRGWRQRRRWPRRRTKPVWRKNLQSLATRTLNRRRLHNWLSMTPSALHSSSTIRSRLRTTRRWWMTCLQVNLTFRQLRPTMFLTFWRVRCNANQSLNNLSTDRLLIDFFRRLEFLFHLRQFKFHCRFELNPFHLRVSWISRQQCHWMIIQQSAYQMRANHVQR